MRIAVAIILMVCSTCAKSMTTPEKHQAQRLAQSLVTYLTFDGSRRENWDSDRLHWDTNKVWRDRIAQACR